MQVSKHMHRLIIRKESPELNNITYKRIKLLVSLNCTTISLHANKLCEFHFHRTIYRFMLNKLEKNNIFRKTITFSL